MSVLQDAVTLEMELKPITLADVELEIAFDLAMTDCVSCPTREGRAAAFSRAQDLHAQRRPHMVARFERERGLRK